MEQTDASTPSVLVTIPTLGQRLDLLEHTLESVATQEAYTPTIAVVCPKKSVDARKLAEKFGATILDDPGTLSGAINVAYREIKPHTYSTWLGDDDLLRPGSLATSVAALEVHPEAVVAYGGCDYINEQDKVLFTNHSSRFAPWIMRWGPNLVPLPGILYRHSAIQQAGEFDESLKYAMDLDMLLRLRKLGGFVFTGKTLAAFRWHTTSTTVANRQASLDEAKRIKAHYLPAAARPFMPLWEIPVQYATRFAARRASAKG
jgi:GT2 family glycosyltransferase